MDRRRNVLRLEDVKQWKDAVGKKETLKHLRGEPLSWKEACLAKCGDCTCGYEDSKADCQVPDCPLYGHMPYRKSKEVKPKNPRTEKQLKSDERLALIRATARRKGVLQHRED
jgi:hypothetical protein